MIACVLVAIPSGLILLARNSYPQAVFWTACYWWWRSPTIR